jgi:hypothetical protein
MLLRKNLCFSHDDKVFKNSYVNFSHRSFTARTDRKVPYRLPWQGMSSCELIAIPAAVMYGNECTQPTVMTEITQGRQEPALPVKSSLFKTLQNDTQEIKLSPQNTRIHKQQ